MDLGIAGRKAAVAAGSAGLGLGSAKALVADGVEVAICGRDEDRLKDAVEILGDAATPIVADLSTTDGAEQFVHDAIAAMGHVDILVANAGGPPPGGFDTTDLAAFQYALDISCKSTIAMCQQAVPPMRERGWGRVVAITSFGARMPLGGLMASSVARAAVTSFVRMLASEVAADGVTVNSAQPGMHGTERVLGLGRSIDELNKSVPTGAMGDPDDFGAAVAFLCSDQAKFITGTGLLIDGGSYPGVG